MAKKKQPAAAIKAIGKSEHATIVVSGEGPLRFSGNLAWDIETGPLEANHEDGALLNPETARVAAIGYHEPTHGRYVIAYDKDESAVLRQFWDLFRTSNAAGFKMIGFNIFGFDLPFLIRRSWFHSVAVPKNIMSSGGRYWCDTFVDLMVQWRCGSYREFIGLDALSRFLGVGAKNGNGELFYRLWDTDRKAAISYLRNDVEITFRCAEKMGFGSIRE